MTLNLTRALAGALCLLPFFFLACWGNPSREGVTPLQAHMYAHYDRAEAVHQSLMHGEMGTAQESAEWIASHSEIHDIPPGTRRYDDAVRAFAGRVAQSTSLKDAAIAAARMGSSCGDCHQAQQVDPRFLMGTAPPGGGGPRAEMARHVWAADRMWVGLLGPSDAAWDEGARGFQGGWLDTQEVLVDPENRARIRALVRHVYDLGARAVDATGAQERAEIYGEFLNTCADCHSMTLVQVTGMK